MKLFNWFKPETNFNLAKVLRNKQEENIVREIDSYLGRKTDYGSFIDRLNYPQHTFFLVSNLEAALTNGNFNQFYFSEHAKYSHETVKALKEVNAAVLAQILQIANNQFPDKSVPKNRIMRQEILMQIEPKAQHIWEECALEFDLYHGDLPTLLVSYVKRHLNEFRR